jgi:hypothetical protein
MGMNRRSFFRKMIGGLAASAAVRTFPFRVFSFPSEIVQPIAVKFIRAFDPAQSKMINRWDVLYGFVQLEVERESMQVTGIKIPEFKDEWPSLHVVRA